jgi:hypothetical protein
VKIIAVGRKRPKVEDEWRMGGERKHCRFGLHVAEKTRKRKRKKTKKGREKGGGGRRRSSGTIGNERD